MTRLPNFKRRFSRVALACLCLGIAGRVQAYIDLAPTMSKIIGDAQKISVVEVVSLNESTHVLTLKEVRTLKGAEAQAPIVHNVASSDGNIVPPAIVQWADVGARGVLFSTRATSLLCFGNGWYQAKSSGGEMEVGSRPLRSSSRLLRFSFRGLADGIATMLKGGDAILTMVQHGADDNAASFDLAFNRMNLPNVIRVQRIRANLAMPGTVMAVSVNPAYVIRAGPGGRGRSPGAFAATLLVGCRPFARKRRRMCSNSGRKAKSAEGIYGSGQTPFRFKRTRPHCRGLSSAPHYRSKCRRSEGSVSGSHQHGCRNPSRNSRRRRTRRHRRVSTDLQSRDRTQRSKYSNAPRRRSRRRHPRAGRVGRSGVR